MNGKNNSKKLGSILFELLKGIYFIAGLNDTCKKMEA
jgi:hypothetical protein